VATSTPSIRQRPALAVSRQPSRFISVDLPDPEAPMIATNSPAAIVAVASCSATTSAGVPGE
jgi:hypothetical protein